MQNEGLHDKCYVFWMCSSNNQPDVGNGNIQMCLAITKHIQKKHINIFLTAAKIQLLLTMLTVELGSQHFLSILARGGEQFSGIGGRCSKKKKHFPSPLSLHFQSHSQIFMYWGSGNKTISLQNVMKMEKKTVEPAKSKYWPFCPLLPPCVTHDQWECLQKESCV